MPATLAIGGAITLAWIVVAILAPVLTSFDPIKVDVMQALKSPGAEHWFGTDAIGRDVLARTLFAARYDLAMAFFGVVGPIILGTIIGLIAGYLGGRIDAVLMRILEVTVSFPYFVLVIAIVAVLGPGLKSYFISLTLVNWVSYARLVRSQALVLRGVDFVLAARGMGFGHLRIMLFHILPNAIVPSIVFVMTDAVLAIVLGSSLGFLGLGVQPPTPEWGAMIADGQTYLTTAWWIAIFPGIAICLLALGLSLTADGLARLLNTES
ncbi:ABC transporter permease [Mesorhizobium sp. M7A.F.Ca.US.006.01.1.1]|uniref:ABC transporter permease n=1 Tax=Mesorhizobium sp. M7A.F.Ca.US.006.01.1.1 TaxID=2496707 RepID=UPI001FE1747C|nr:ABC transporter permease [Mesorhizobium sp. M7A.F.Ca.US.006.01.1.1]